MSADAPKLVLLAAGGTGGHLFPAEALGNVLMMRGYRVRLVTDARAIKYSALFTPETVDVVPSETLRGRNPVALAKTGLVLGGGFMKALGLVRRLKPAAVVGFGGYPTLPPLLAARVLGIPTIVHDANAVMGRANRVLAKTADAVAVTFAKVLDGDASLAAKATVTGNPVRPAVLAASLKDFEEPRGSSPFRIVVTGGSQGARVMGDVVPEAMARLEPALLARLQLVQQVREDDLPRVKAKYASHRIQPELASFFADLPARIAASHLVISRSGATTVAELAAIGRPSILVPLPGAIDQDQYANAGVLADIGGALRIVQSELTPDRLAAEISALAAEPQRLSEMAAAARSAGQLNAAENLADLVTRVAKLV